MNSKDELSVNEIEVEMKTVFCSKTYPSPAFHPKAQRLINWHLAGLLARGSS